MMKNDEKNMKTFAAIDFETANNHPQSICSVGLVVVRDGKIAEKFYELIRPAPHFYNYWNTQIHGLAASDTATAAPFPEVWARIVPLLARSVLPLPARSDGPIDIPLPALSDDPIPRSGTIDILPLVAHNSPFDEGCLRAAHAHYGLAYPAYEFHCTCRMSRRAFPHLPNHKLGTVAAYVGFDLKNHHHALADAEACAAIALTLMQ
jgi:DNA polymerase-3 subunit epsilon